MAEPPSYDDFDFEELVGSSHDPSDLPAYTRRHSPPPGGAQVNRGPKEFTYNIKKSGSPWATLTIQGDPRLTKVIPTILEGKNILGSAKLTLQSPEAIQAVCIVVRGEIINGARAAIPTVFFESKHVLWSAAEGDPNSPGPSQKSSRVKLKGDYNWPFSIALPQLGVTKSGKAFYLPHTFMDRSATFTIQYIAELRIVRGMFRPDDKLPCVFSFFSMRQPGLPSPLRMLAYQENSPLLGPDADPEGWHTETLSMKGTIFRSRTIDVKCMFSLATPLCYTRSSSIPCAMTIECQDEQALDVLSAPTAPMVFLEAKFLEESQGSKLTVEPCGKAVFWPSTEGAATESPFQRRLMGEIHLKRNLQPTSAVKGFSIEYAVAVFPLQAAGFKHQEENAPLVRQVVEITTRYASGPRQKTYSPPSYETRNSIVDQYYTMLVMATNESFL